MAVVTDVATEAQVPSSWPQWYTEETANPMSLSVPLLALCRAQIFVSCVLICLSHLLSVC
jgi:hypothetical protein